MLLSCFLQAGYLMDYCRVICVESFIKSRKSFQISGLCCYKRNTAFFCYHRVSLGFCPPKQVSYTIPDNYSINRTGKGIFIGACFPAYISSIVTSEKCTDGQGLDDLLVFTSKKTGKPFAIHEYRVIIRHGILSSRNDIPLPEPLMGKR